MTILAVAERGIAFPVGLDKTEEQAGVEHNRIEQLGALEGIGHRKKSKGGDHVVVWAALEFP